jgi:hypothetical protein
MRAGFSFDLMAAAAAACRGAPPPPLRPKGGAFYSSVWGSAHLVYNGALSARGMNGNGQMKCCFIYLDARMQTSFFVWFLTI